MRTSLISSFDQETGNAVWEEVDYLSPDSFSFRPRDPHAMQSRSDLDELDAATLSVTMARLLETLAALHSIDHVAVGLGRFGRSDDYAQRQVRRWPGQWEIVGARCWRPWLAIWAAAWRP